MLVESGLGALLVLAAVAAGMFGAARERQAVIVFAGLAAASLLAGHWQRPHAAAWICLTADLGALGWLAKIAWRAPRRWPVWALAPEAVAAAASLSFLLQPDMGSDIYVRALIMTRYAAVLALAIGNV